MKWYHYLFGFLAGAFLTNAVPHFVHGISGEAFPSPFATPPGVGLSSPEINMAWALVNLVVGYLFLRIGRVSPAKPATMLVLLLGVAGIGFMCSISFQKKQPVGATPQVSASE